MIESVIATQVHGRYLVRPAESSLVLAGFHGYGESAHTHFARLEHTPGSEQWFLISIQGLHRFYERRTNAVVASWMTSQDRELAIADNIAYIARVLQNAVPAWPEVRGAVFAGFSQGVAMAFRAAVTTRGPAAAATRPWRDRPQCHVLAVGGDIPPELSAHDLGRLSSVLVCRGAEDPWYGRDAYERDVARLTDAGVPVEAVVVPGAHEWSSDVTTRAGNYLTLVRARV